MTRSYVSRRCAIVVLRTPLVFSWTGQGGKWVLVAMNSLSTGLIWLMSNACLLLLVDCVVKLSSDSPALGRTCVYIQRVSTGLEGTGSETAASQKAHLSWQNDQTGLTSWTGIWTSLVLLLFLIWPVGSGTNTTKEKNKQKRLARYSSHYFKTSFMLDCMQRLTKIIVHNQQHSR